MLGNRLPTPDKKQETSIAVYQHFQAKVDAHNKGYKIKRFRCDKGRGEFDHKLFQILLAARGTALVVRANQRERTNVLNCLKYIEEKDKDYI